MERPGHPRLGLPDRRRRPRRRRSPGSWSPTPWTICSAQKIATGFDFLEREAGFEIGDTLIAYSPASTYARAICGRHAQHAAGSRCSASSCRPSSARSSASAGCRRNWLLAKICELATSRSSATCRCCCGCSLVYKLISEAFPGPAPGDRRPGNSSSSPIAASISRCRCADPVHHVDGHRPAGRHRGGLSCVQRWATNAPGRDRPAFPVDLGRLRPDRSACRCSSGCSAARPADMSWPELQGLQLRGRHGASSRSSPPLLVGLTLYTVGLRRRDRALRHPGRAQGPERGGAGARAVARAGRCGWSCCRRRCASSCRR